MEADGATAGVKLNPTKPVIDLSAARFHLLTGKPMSSITHWITYEAPESVRKLLGLLEGNLHHSQYRQVCDRYIHRTRDSYETLVVQTQSLEMIRTFFEANQANPPYELLLHRFECDRDGVLRVVTYDEETLQAALEMGLEVR